MTHRIWITGAHGFIGRHLARALVAAGHSVAGIGHGAWPAPAAMAWGVGHWLNGDLSSSNLHALGAMTGSPDVVMHLAGGSSVGAAIAQPREDFARTVSSTLELFEWLRQHSQHTGVVAVSSAAVYGAGHVGPISEGADLAPYSPYGHHKRMMESLCHSYGDTYGMRSIVARLFSVYGPGLRKQLLWDLCCKLDAGQSPVELGGNGDELRDWTDVSDVVRALVSLMELADTHVPVCNLGSGLATPVRDVAAQVLSAWQPSGNTPSLAFNGRSRSGDPFSLQSDSTQLAAMGFEWRVPLTRGLENYVRWFQSPERDRY